MKQPLRCLWRSLTQSSDDKVVPIESGLAIKIHLSYRHFNGTYGFKLELKLVCLLYCWGHNSLFSLCRSNFSLSCLYLGFTWGTRTKGIRWTKGLSALFFPQEYLNGAACYLCTVPSQVFKMAVIVLFSSFQGDSGQQGFLGTMGSAGKSVSVPTLPKTFRRGLVVPPF